MKVENLLHIIFSFFCLTACSSNPTPGALQKEVHIKLSADSSSIELHEVGPDILEHLERDSLSKKEWQGFFAVYPDTNDPELRDLQVPLEGHYIVRDSILVFLPKEDFKKDSQYFARFYGRKILEKPSDVVREGNLASHAEIVEFNFKR